MSSSSIATMISPTSSNPSTGPLDHTVEPDPALDDRLDAEIFERSDNRRLFRHRHQLEIALTLLCRGAGTEDRFAGAQFDGIVGVRTKPIGDSDLIVDRHRREQDLAFGLKISISDAWTRSTVGRADPGFKATAPSSTTEFPGRIRPTHWAGTV